MKLGAGVLLLGSLAVGLPAGAVTAMGPVCNASAKVLSTTYYSCSGSTHTALDIGGVPCGEPLYGPLVGTFTYRPYGGCANTCSGTNTSCNGGAGNYYVVTGASGWDFRMLHANNGSTAPVTKTCNRCLLGTTVGSTGSATTPHVHLDNRQYGTRKTAWYSGTVTCGSPASCTNVIGYPTL
jgi:hypothetical protein